MRYRLVVIAIIAAGGLAASSAASSKPDGGGGRTGGPPPTARGATAGTGGAVFVLTGSGYGHGVGLSQYGARAQALAGRSFSDILGFYYPGTALRPSPKATVRVLLAPAAATLTISSATPYTVRDASGASHALPGGDLALGPDLQVLVDGAPVVLVGPATFVPSAGSSLSVGSKSYRGRIEVTSTGTALQAVDVVALESYVQGVVPGEMPSAWPAAALEAQAVAARSYALASIVKGKAWDLYPDGRSQQYLGAAAETPQTAAAVKATARQVLFFGGKVATTFYSSSSGGRTASALDTFGLDLPYLPAQPDPWDEGSPYHLWQSKSYTGAKLGKALGMRSVVTEVRSQISGSLRVATLVAVAADGSSLELSGSEIRKRLVLRSTAFRLGTLRFVTPESPTTTGTRVRLAGLARDVDVATLERLVPDGGWVPVVRRLTVRPDGSFAAVVRPTQTTTYRLSASGLPGPELTIAVVAASA
ncbi:MAG: SpoIID/LytB domain-containing protein [Gaiellaceae bacterium]